MRLIWVSTGRGFMASTPGWRALGGQSGGAVPDADGQVWGRGQGELVAFLPQGGGEVVVDLVRVAEANVCASLDAVAPDPDPGPADAGDPHRGVAQDGRGAVAVQRGP